MGFFLMIGEGFNTNFQLVMSTFINFVRFFQAATSSFHRIPNEQT